MSWTQFVGLIELHFLDWEEYVFRGQRDASWPLRSKFDREYRRAQSDFKKIDIYRGLSQEERELVEQSNPKLSIKTRDELLATLLNEFKKACTGRRGSTPRKLTDDEWWALGQHYGLATPLLDWTRSPYVAAYFALAEKKESTSGCRAMWAYSHLSMLEIVINMPENLDKDPHLIPVTEIINGYIEENSRIVSQNGLFTKTPLGEDIEETIEKSIDLNGHSPILYKIEIPNEQREEFLRHLESMNIHHGSLFPDLKGAAELTNRKLERASSDLIWKAKPEFVHRMLSNNEYHKTSTSN